MTNGALDRISGLIFLICGIVVTFGAWQMPRFENQSAHIYQAPGLTPGLLGIGLAICGLILALRQPRDDAQERDYWDTILGNPTNRARAIGALILTLGYAAGLFGNMNFALATFFFVFAFIALFELVLRPQNEETPPNMPRTLLIAAVIAAITGFGCQYVFETLFLVRLP